MINIKTYELHLKKSQYSKLFYFLSINQNSGKLCLLYLNYYSFLIELNIKIKYKFVREKSAFIKKDKSRQLQM